MTDSNETPPKEAPDDRAPSFSESLSAAARQSGLAKLTPGESPTASALLGALGGIRGLLESVVPGFAFLVIYTVTHDLVISVLVPVAIALVFVVARAGARSPMTQAIAGAVGIALTAVLAIVTKDASNNFLPGIFINAGALVLFVTSILVRWPLVGVLVGLILGEPTEWRQDPAKRRALTLATWVWIFPFALRVGVEVPLYLAHNVTALAATKLITGIPLYLGTLWVTWLLVRAVYGKDDAESDDAELSDDAE
ncbi:MAG: hypothetical protein JWR36_1571 [Glaciihabitans sp.]|jgi:hypothetical protein|nr:hypothetical protein [Glaciihabitans sp.]MDQ1571086.1 hypothetical protein [Actinomycetota bacterium]